MCCVTESYCKVFELCLCPRCGLIRSVTGNRGRVAASEGLPHGSCGTNRWRCRRRPGRTHRVRPSDRPDQPVRRRALGAVLVLRDAHDPRVLPLLLAHRRWPRASEDHRDRNRRRLRRAGLPLHGPRRLDRRPGARHGAHRLLRRRGGDVRPHRARGRAGPRRRRRGSRIGRAGLRRLEGQCVVAARHALREGRPALPTAVSRCSIWASTWARSSARSITGLLQTRLGLPLGLRRRRRRDGARARAVRRLPAQPRRPRPRRAEPVAAQRYWLGRRRWS